MLQQALGGTAAAQPFKLCQRSLTASTFVTGAQKASEAVAAAAPTTSTVTSPETKTSRLLPEQEQVLLRFFGAQDRVDHREAALLARQVHISTILMCRKHIPNQTSHKMLVVLPDISAVLPGQATNRCQAGLLSLCAMVPGLLPKLSLPLGLPCSVCLSSSISNTFHQRAFAGKLQRATSTAVLSQSAEQLA
jgi:hypothetical protein